MKRSRILDVVIAGLIGLILSFPISLQLVYSWTGNTNTFSPGFAEINQINATQYWFRDLNRSQIYQGNYTGIGLDTDWINATDFYLRNINITERLQGNYSQTGLITTWLELGGVNRTTWPAGGGAGLDEYPFEYFVFNNVTGVYAINSTGAIEFSGTNNTRIINWALGNLTAGRVNYEKVIIAGNYSIGGSLRLSSDYTELDLRLASFYAEVFGGGDPEHYMLEIEHLNHIVIRGGYFNGNILSQPVAGSDMGGVMFKNCSDVYITGTKIEDFRCDAANFGGLDFFACVDCLGENLWIEGCQHAGVRIAAPNGYAWSHPTINVKIIKSIFKDNVENTSHAAQALVIANTPQYASACGFEGCWANNSGNQGYQMYQYTYDCFVKDCYSGYVANDHIVDGNGPCYRSIFEGNILEGFLAAGVAGVDLSVQSHGAQILDNDIINVGGRAVYVDNRATLSVISDNRINGTFDPNAMLILGNWTTITSNTINMSSSFRGIQFSGPASGPKYVAYCVCDGNIIRGGRGIAVTDGMYIVISNNIIDIENAFPRTPILLDSDSQYCTVEGNIGLLDGQMLSTCCLNNLGTENVIRYNEFFYVDDGGTDTILPTITAPFVIGSTYNPITGEIQGWNITIGGDYASTAIVLPEEVHQVIRFKIYGASWIAELHNMTLQIEINGASSNEPFNTENIAIATLNSTTLNFAAHDVIYWTIDANDDADVDDLVGGDSLQIIIFHDAASGGACATNMAVRDIIIEYG